MWYHHHNFQSSTISMDTMTPHQNQVPMLRHCLWLLNWLMICCCLHQLWFSLARPSHGTNVPAQRWNHWCQARLPGLLHTWLQSPPVKDERVRAPDVWSAVLAWKWDWDIYKIYRRKKWMIHWRLAWTEHTYFWCPNDTLSRLLLNLEHHPPVVAWL